MKVRQVFRSRLWLGRLALVLGLLLLAAGPVANGIAFASRSQQISGWLDIVWGDGRSPDSPERVLYFLTTDQGERVKFHPPQGVPFRDLLTLRGKKVLAEGQWVAPQDPDPPAKGFTSSSVRAASGDPISALIAPAAVSGSKPWVSILCKFSDVTTEPKAPSYFLDMYRSTYPGMDHYWREQSYGMMNVAGSAATTRWFTLPNPRSYYVYDRTGDGVAEFDHSRASKDCTSVADASVNFSSFVGINMMFNSDLDGYAWGGSHYMTLDGVSKSWYTTWEPPWGYQDITVIAHEMGHGFGLPHSSGNYGKTYDNQWDVMSDTWSNCSLSRNATFGCLGQHTIAYHKNKEGWIPSSQRQVVSLYSQVAITMEQLANPTTSSFLMAEVPINGSSSRYYTVEVRRKAGYDVKLPGQAVIIHEVDTSRQIPAHVVDSDNNGNTGDGGAQWLEGETFNDTANKIWVRVDAATTTGFNVTICNVCDQTTPTPTVTATPTTSPTATPTASPTPTPPPASTVHIGNLDGAASQNGNKWNATVTVTVHNTTHQPVGNALVTGSWSGGASGPGSCTTNSSGQCSITKTGINTKTASVAFGVSKVSGTGLTYSSTANHDPDGSSNGTVIMVARP
jgi:M6 family metalloprotease-like protein